MKSILLCIPLAALAAYVTAYSSPASMPLMLITLGIGALLGTAVASVWFHGKWHDRILKAGKVVLPATTAIYLLGYFWETLMVML